MSVIRLEAPPGSVPMEQDRPDLRVTPEQLFREHLAFVFRTLRRFGVDASNVDDAVQDVFVVALRRANEFKGDSSYRTWLFGIAHNIARETSRRQRRAETHETIAENQEAQLPSPFEQLTSAEALRFVDDFLKDLDDAKREVFIMIELEQLPAPEVAQALEVNLNTVYSRLRAARQSFTALLKQRFTDEP